jgi:hypothetical protein
MNALFPQLPPKMTPSTIKNIKFRWAWPIVICLLLPWQRALTSNDDWFRPWRRALVVYFGRLSFFVMLNVLTPFWTFENHSLYDQLGLKECPPKKTDPKWYPWRFERVKHALVDRHFITYLFKLWMIWKAIKFASILVL